METFISDYPGMVVSSVGILVGGLGWIIIFLGKRYLDTHAKAVNKALDGNTKAINGLCSKLDRIVETVNEHGEAIAAIKAVCHERHEIDR